LHFESAVKHARQEFVNTDLPQKKAAWLRQLAIFKLEKYLIDFEEVFTQSGGKVLWSVDAQEAVQQVKELLKTSGSQSVVHSESSIIREAGLSAALADGEYRVYTDTHPDALRLKSPVYITSADMVAADTGSVVNWAMDKEKEALAQGAGIFIVLCGIENITPSVSDLPLFYSLYTTYSYPHRSGGQLRIFSGGFSQRHRPGPAEFYVVFIDNGRSNILALKELREAMLCIHCGACEIVCPVFRNIGKESYPGFTAAPINAVLSPHKHGMKQYAHLSTASTLCGACSEICPVGIDLPHLLRVNREMAVKQGFEKVKLKAAYRIFGFSMQNRKRLEKIPAFVKRLVVVLLFRKPGIKPPVFTKESFSKSWIRLRGE
jgi:L-lactate dehydrogenase complex protein LldF